VGLFCCNFKSSLSDLSLNIMIILGIETSCDETAASVVKVVNGRFFVLSNVVSSQIELHKKYGGVVPELAAREHTNNIVPVIDQAINEAKIKPKKIDRIAVTTSPGLLTALLIGVQTAKSLALAWDKPLVGVDHLKSHLYANWLTNQKIVFPAIGVVVSGGHTQIILMSSPTSFKLIGNTRDDAAGEAFDKVAQLLKLGYPGGPQVATRALQGNAQAFAFPRPMIDSSDFDFSFSGLKTAVLYTAQKQQRLTPKVVNDICASFQQAVVDVIIAKAFLAVKKHKAKSVILAGGVAANKLLRESFTKKAEEEKVFFANPDLVYCTDNAAMIASTGYFSKPQPLNKITVKPYSSL
jgi:N6-L-threonylcarbamoyladenine synthase